MSASGSPQSRKPPSSLPRLTAPSSTRQSPLLLLTSVILVLLLAIAFHRWHRISFFNYGNPIKPTFFQRLARIPCISTYRLNPILGAAITMSSVDGPFLSGGGYCSEAWSYITSLHERIPNPSFILKIEHHGDLVSPEFWQGLPEKSQRLAFELHSTACRSRDTIVICHSEPGAWYPPLYETISCPPSGYKSAAIVVGRTMFETDRLTPEHVRRCNHMDEIWVPTEFHVSTFVGSGVDPSKIVKIVQPVDIEFFDPAKHEAMALPGQELVLRSRTLGSGSSTDVTKKNFVFLSIFKWELRKGWDVLLRAYLTEFSKTDGVLLCLLISAYHTDTDFSNKISAFVEEQGIQEPVGGWAPVRVIKSHIPQAELPRIYMAADIFILPSRGEGWGRPIVEAMSMGLPVIATNWSGPTEYLTQENGYPLPVYEMREVREGPFKGHLWAEPSMNNLRGLLRHVVSYPEEAKARGMKARMDIIKRFSPEVVAKIVSDRIMEIWTSHNG
ncbi:hypothetical protein HPP92_006034 [Vanilla planifolia]|uniref:Glycosyl transferase family 1 domain-containing protein n=1 Tax=Vanilla planifolia TaxID=51239 RepID=A0A835VFF6_VANPL|nr:hypothetical protein HPP92_006034 [Vanilla planifolia]